MNTQKYMDLFLEEAGEHLQNLNRLLIELEADPSDAEAINEIFRSVHTIKGLAATMGFEKISTLSHQLENLIESLKEAKRAEPEVTDLLFEGIDLLEAMLKSPQDGEEFTDLEFFLEKVKRVKKEEKMERKSPFLELISPGAGKANYELKIRLEESCALKSVRAFTVLKSLAELGDITATFPDPEKLENEEFGKGFTVRLRSQRVEEEIKNKVLALPEIEEVEVRKLKEKVRKNQSIRVGIDTLDTLMNITGELIINRSVLEEIAKKHELEELKDALEMTKRLTTDLQYVVMQARMVPLSYVFSTFPRLIRDISKKEGKEVDFNIYGGDIELDRAVIDEIVEPIVHILRNAVSHGIESPEERERKGKPRRGRVTLSAVKEKDHVVISVEDDGSGIDLEKVKETAVNRGLISREKAATLKREEVLDLLFLPGFSTASEVTEISGRGVGLDAVKSQIESLGGHIEIETYQGKGTKVSLRLPITMAILQALLVRIGGVTYGVPISNVLRVLESTSLRKLHNKQVIKLDEEIIPVVHLFNANEEGRFIVVLEKGNKRTGVTVDEIVGIQEVVLKSLSGAAARLHEFAGGTILGNGDVALMLDVGSIVE
jgi:two-component system chemotaxis sensor kinase CheA